MDLSQAENSFEGLHEDQTLRVVGSCGQMSQNGVRDNDNERFNVVVFRLKNLRALFDAFQKVICHEK